MTTCFGVYGKFFSVEHSEMASHPSPVWRGEVVGA